MRNPAEEFFPGLGTEPVPGVSVGWGMHMRDSGRSRYAGKFVADASGDFPVEQEWRKSFRAFTLTVDADVFTKTIGGLWR